MTMPNVEPEWLPPPEEFENRLREILRKEEELKARLRAVHLATGFRNKRKNKQELSRLEQELHTTGEERLRLRKELDFMLTNRQSPIDRTPDEDVQPFTYCVGSCYGLALYVDSEGKLFYAQQPPLTAEVGECAPDFSLLSDFSRLPKAEREMIFEWLLEDPNTPAFFKERLKEEGIDDGDDPEL